MADYTNVLGVADLADGAMAYVEAGGEPLLLARVGETYFASQAYCPHLHGHLWQGRLEGTVVTCPRHRSQFDLTDGHVIRWTDWTGIAEAAAEALRHPRPLKVYEVKVEDGRVLVGPVKQAPASD